MTLLNALVQTSAAVGATAARSEKVKLVASFLKGLEPAEAPIGVAYLSSQLRQRQTIQRLLVGEPAVWLHCMNCDVAVDGVGPTQR